MPKLLVLLEIGLLIAWYGSIGGTFYYINRYHEEHYEECAAANLTCTPIATGILFMQTGTCALGIILKDRFNPSAQKFKWK